MNSAATSYTIGEICELVRGVSPTLKTEPGEYPLVVTAAFRRTSADWQIEGPAVCVPLISSTGHGDAAIHRVHYQDGKFALANLLVALKPQRRDLCDAKFLYHVLQTQKDKLLVPLMLGTANVSLKERDVAGVSIFLPPLEEQRRIVRRIEAIEKKILEVRREKNSQQADIKAMLLAAFSRIVDGAPLRPFGQVAPLVRRPVEPKMGEEYPELGIRSFGKGTFHKPPLDFFTVGSKRLFSIQPGDLLFSNVFAWEGAIAVAKPSDLGRFGSHRFMTCVPKAGLASSNFLSFYFLTEEGLDKIGAASPGGAGRNRTLGLEKLAQIDIPVPEIKKQIWFESLQSKASEMLSLQAEATIELDAMLPAILDKAFKGEL